MRRPTLLFVIVATWLFVCGAGALAWQSMLPKPGLTQKDIEVWATNAIHQNRRDSRLGSAATATAVLAMGPDQRAALVREVLTVAKTHLMSPAFQAAHAARIKQSDRAVDHGINPDAFTAGADPQVESRTILAVQMVDMFQMQPVEVLNGAFENQRIELAETIKTSTGEERAAAQRLLTKLNALVPLQKSNPEGFKKAYTLAQSEAMGGPATEAALQAATSSTEKSQQLRDEQRAWNHYNLKVVLKRMLTEFVAEAAKVDFTIPTKMDGGYAVFVDPLRQMESDTEELAYRLGRVPTAAALVFLRAWLKEL